MSAITPLSSSEAARTVGITTTIPVEMVFAAGLRPLDLNNVFITSPIAPELVEEAEQRGFPRNSCAWNKGIYATARRLGLRRIVGVVQGDCANTHAMLEMMRADGADVVPFAFPYQPDDRELLALGLERFARALGTTVEEGEAWKRRLDDVRAPAHRIDELCWREGRVTGREQHLWTISCSDFLGDPDEYARQAREVAKAAEEREPRSLRLRLGLIGIPPICGGLFEFLEVRGAQVVFNEIPRQFAMPGRTDTLIEQYLAYTYPYDVFRRLEDIREQVARRRLDGVIHYVQSFCFRQVQDAIIRRALDLPMMTLEFDRPGPLDMRTVTRLEAFLELVAESKDSPRARDRR